MRRNVRTAAPRFAKRNLYHGALDDLALAIDPLTQNRYALAGRNPVSVAEADEHWVQLAVVIEVMDWEPIACGLLALILLGIGIPARTGRWRSWAALRQNPYLPPYVRNGPSTLLPTGVAFLGLLAAGVLLGAEGAWRAVGLVLFVVVMIGMVVAFGLMMRPPDWLKPRWLVEEERRGRAGGGEAAPARDGPAHETAAPGGRFELTGPHYALAWGGLGFLLVAWLVLGWPPSVLVGVGVSASMLVALRPRGDSSGPARPGGPD